MEIFVNMTRISKQGIMGATYALNSQDHWANFLIKFDILELFTTIDSGQIAI